MEKRFSKSKIIILSIAILITILTLSIGIFSVIYKNKDERKNNIVNAWGSDDGIKLRTISQTINGMTYSVEYTISFVNSNSSVSSGSVSFKYNSQECLVGDIYGTLLEHDTGLYIKKDGFTIDSFKVYNDYGYKLYNYLRSSGLYIEYYHIDYDLIGNDDISDKNFTYTCSGIRFTLEEGRPIVITVDEKEYSKSTNWISQDMSYYNISDNKLIMTHTSDGEIDIRSEEALKLLAYEFADTLCTNNDSLRTADVYLKTNLNMSKVSNMIPIGNENRPYISATFDGGGNTIEGLALCGYTNANTNYYGLFGCITDVTIKNLHIKELNWAKTITSSKDGVYGSVLVALSKGKCVVENVLISGSSINIKNNEGKYNSGAFGAVGSLVGRNINGSITINNCGSKCDVLSEGLNCIGGLVGDVPSNSSVSISNSYFKGIITATEKNLSNAGLYIGGLVGGANPILTATNCYVSLTEIIATCSYRIETYSAGTSYVNYYYVSNFGFYQFASHTNLTLNGTNKIYCKRHTLTYIKPTSNSFGGATTEQKDAEFPSTSTNNLSTPANLTELSEDLLP